MKIQGKILQWGASLGIPIKKSLAKEEGLQVGDLVEVVIKPIKNSEIKDRLFADALGEEMEKAELDKLIIKRKKQKKN